jgi:putative ABC transport system permease protein
MEESAEVELVTRVRGFRNGTIVTAGGKKLHETRHGMADDAFFKVFSFPLIAGNPEKALSLPNTVVISKSAAKKYFGDSDPMGKTINIYERDLLVTGIYEDMPANSHFHLDILFSVATIPRYSEPNWGLNVFKNYVLLRENGDIENLRNDLANIVKTRHFESVEQYKTYLSKGGSISYPLMPLKDIHLNSHLLWEFEANGNATYVKYFTFIAFFILLIAVVNYVNLSTARSAGRAREVGIRKTVGSTRIALIRQFLTESVIISIIATVLSVVIIQLLMPYFRSLVDKPWLKIPFMQHPEYLIILLLFAIVLGLIAGGYPALILSSFKPVTVLRGRFNTGKRGSGLRNALVIFQFSMSIILFIGALVVQKQMSFIHNSDLGFDKEQVLVIKTFGEIGDKLSTLKEVLLENPAVISASASTSIPGKNIDNRGSRLFGTDNWAGINIIAVDEDFADVMKLQMAEGRFFAKEISTDEQAVIVNESTVKRLASGNLIDRKFDIWIGGLHDVFPYHVIGITKDFHYESFYEPVRPMQLILTNGKAQWGESFLSVRIRPENIQETVKYVASVWNKFIPNSPFEYSFLDSIYDQLHANENLTRNVFSVFTFFALFVSCLGLLGLSSFTAEQKTKEIGIRKAFGASVQGLILKLSKEYISWILIANLIAWPTAYLVMDRWLQNFAFRTEIGWEIFILASISSLLIALITVCFQFTRAALVNPIETLRYE